MSDPGAAPGLDTCGCCEGLTEQTPARIANPPARSTIAYRAGTYAGFRASMLARFSSPAYPALRDLRVREEDDFTIALLDAWAVAADVLTFYQERIANEHYLRTAQERRSVLHLARAIGYELRPGVAASALLAFTAETAPGAPTRTTIPAGTPVQSMPEPGERSYVYETVEAIEARPAWNAIRPRATKRHPLPHGTSELWFEGIAENLEPGDGVLYRVDGSTTAVAFGIVSAVRPVQAEPPLPPTPGTPGTPGAPARTEVTLHLVSSTPVAPITTALPDLRPAPPSAGPLVAAYAPNLPAQPATWQSADLAGEAKIAPFDLDHLFANLEASPHPPPQALVFRTRAAIFGHNAPAYAALPSVMRAVEPVYAANGTLTGGTAPFANLSTMWAENALDKYPSETSASATGDPKTIYLDAVDGTATSGSLVVLKDGANWTVRQVEQAAEISRSAFTLTGKVTRLRLDTGAGFASFGIRRTTVFAGSAVLPLARRPETAAVAGDANELDGWYPGLLPGRRVIVSGESATAPGVTGSEARVLEKVEHVLVQPGGPTPGGTRITFAKALTSSYLRTTVTVNANVAAATHGETVREVLGSGDGRQAFQRFALRQPPLTYVSSASPSGTATTLTVYVNDVRWREVPTLVGQGPDDRVYTARLDDDGVTTVQFGDGRTGARLPTGVENVRAVYRRGSGLEGQVKAGQLTLLGARPAGVVGVANPLPPAGADDRESLADARRNAPFTVLTLDRIVSLRDYEDFARAFPGVAKAHATWTRSGERRGVLITVLGPRGATLVPETPIYDNLVAALRGAGDPHVPLRVVSAPPKLFRLSAKVKTDPDRVREQVLATVEWALRAAFAFEERGYGQPVTLSEVIATIQAVAGVLAVDVDALFRPPAPTGPQPSPVLRAELPRPGADANALPAELLILDPAPMVFGGLE